MRGLCGRQSPFFLASLMITESYTLTYSCEALENMSGEKRQVFEGLLRKYVISQAKEFNARKIIFYFYKDHFLEVVARWPWLLCSDLGHNIKANVVISSNSKRSRIYTP